MESLCGSVRPQGIRLWPDTEVATYRDRVGVCQGEAAAHKELLGSLALQIPGKEIASRGRQYTNLYDLLESIVYWGSQKTAAPQYTVLTGSWKICTTPALSSAITGEWPLVTPYSPAIPWKHQTMTRGQPKQPLLDTMNTKASIHSMRP